MSDSRPDSDLATSVRALHAHLEATATLPVTESASRWLGEADAVDDATLDALETRLEQVRDLLDEVEGTGSDEANDHVRAARDLAADALAEL